MSRPPTTSAPQPSDDLEAVIAEASRRLEATAGPAPAGEVPADDVVLHCANHPTVETQLRCNRCGKPICNRCAIRTPVGYRCRECLVRQQAVFFNGGPSDYWVGGAIALVLGGLFGYIMLALGGFSWLFAIILGPTVGVAIAEAVRFAIRRRRSRNLWLVVAGAVVVGAVLGLALSLTHLDLWRILTLGLFLVLAVGAASARLR